MRPQRRSSWVISLYQRKRRAARCSQLPQTTRAGESASRLIGMWRRVSITHLSEIATAMCLGQASTGARVHLATCAARRPWSTTTGVRSQNPPAGWPRPSSALRSKMDTAQINELLCKALCHNLCVLIQSTYELGIEPEFA
jgi:hypothetical protein